MKKNLSGDLQLLLPLDCKISKVFEKLEHAKKNRMFGIAGYGLVSNTLDDVFCQLHESGASIPAVPTDDEVDDTINNNINNRRKELDLKTVTFVRPSFTTKVKLQLQRRYRVETRR